MPVCATLMTVLAMISVNGSSTPHPRPFIKVDSKGCRLVRCHSACSHRPEPPKAGKADPAACSEARLSTREPARACLSDPSRTISLPTSSTQSATSSPSQLRSGTAPETTLSATTTFSRWRLKLRVSGRTDRTIAFCAWATIVRGSCIIAPRASVKAQQRAIAHEIVQNRRLAYKIVQMAERVSVNPH